MMTIQKMNDKKKEIDGKVSRLKQKLKEITTNYTIQAYYILGEIYDLRKSINKDYQFKDLFFEVREHFDNYEQMYRLVQLYFATPKTWELIKSNKITTCYVLGSFLTTIELRNDERFQNKFFKKVVEEKMDYNGTISFLRNYNLKKKKTSHEKAIDFAEVLKDYEAVTPVEKQYTINIDKETYELLQEAYNKIKKSHNYIIKRGLRFVIANHGKYITTKEGKGRKKGVK